MRYPLGPKIILCASLITILLVVLISQHISTYTPQDVIQKIESLHVEDKANVSDFKYMLLYTSPFNEPFINLGIGQDAFIRRNCSKTNCVVVHDENFLLGDMTKFDAILFAGPEIMTKPEDYFPKERSTRQKYVFASVESSSYYPACSNRFDSYFNWTWTFRLDSDLRWGYMDIKDSKNNIIGPNKVMHWMRVEDMDPIGEKLKVKLSKKKKAAAWFVSNCNDRSGRLDYAFELRYELGKLNLQLDVYGECGTKTCERWKNHECMRMVDDTYYFYLSFENSFSEDYVTEKLLQALQIDVIPIVYGGANYTRFMPDGIYLNARDLGPAKLAERMDELIKDPEEYASFFKWKKYYHYQSKHDLPETNEYCRMCELLNNEEQVKKTTIVENFRDWWDSPKQC